MKTLFDLLTEKQIDERRLDNVLAVNKNEIALTIENDVFDAKNEKKIRVFIKNNPDFHFHIPYEGYVVYFFKTKPCSYMVRDTNMYHRGGGCFINVNGQDIFVSLDLD